MSVQDKILWTERDAGEKLSIVMFGLIGFGMVAVLLVSGLQKLINGPELTDRLFGAIWPVLIAFWTYRGVRWWRRRNAR